MLSASSEFRQELCESRGGRPGLSVLTSLMVSVDVKSLSSSLIYQPTSEDIKNTTEPNLISNIHGSGYSAGCEIVDMAGPT